MALALLENPEQAEILIQQPEKIPQAVDEALRYDSPVQMVFRKTTCETDLAGTRLPSGSQIAVILGSANRDETFFEDPDKFEVERKPQGFPGFGFGKHFCLGSALARLEAETSFQGLMPHWPDISRVSSDVERIQSFLVRGPQRLDLRMAHSAQTRRRTA
jgi:cytochrome P450